VAVAVTGYVVVDGRSLTVIAIVVVVVKITFMHGTLHRKVTEPLCSCHTNVSLVYF